MNLNQHDLNASHSNMPYLSWTGDKTSKDNTSSYEWPIGKILKEGVKSDHISHIFLKREKFKVTGKDGELGQKSDVGDRRYVTFSVHSELDILK